MRHRLTLHMVSYCSNLTWVHSPVSSYSRPNLNFCLEIPSPCTLQLTIQPWSSLLFTAFMLNNKKYNLIVLEDYSKSYK